MFPPPLVQVLVSTSPARLVTGAISLRLSRAAAGISRIGGRVGQLVTRPVIVFEQVRVRGELEIAVSAAWVGCQPAISTPAGVNVIASAKPAIRAARLVSIFPLPPL